MADKVSTERDRFRAALSELAQLDKSELHTALRTILARGAVELEVQRVSYWELTPDRSAIRCRVLALREPAEFREGGELRATDFPAYFEAMLASRSIVADDAWTDPRTSEFCEAYFKPNDIRSMLDIPVWRAGRLAGVLCHEHVGSARQWQPHEQDFAVGIGNLISVALESVGRREAEEKFALIARATNDVLWDIDLITGSIDWSESVQAIFRYAPAEVQPTQDWTRERIHPDDRARVEEGVRAAVSSGKASWSDQHRFMRGDGSFATVMNRGLIMRDSRGTPIRVVGSMTDISERLELQTRIALSDRMASIGTLAAGVAHEINNPLTYVMTNLMVGLEEIGNESIDRARMRDLIVESNEGIERIRRIVRDLQILSRPREDDVEALDIHSVIESSLNMTLNQIRHRGRLVRMLEPVPPVRMNRARLGQVLLNLIVNAAQAIPEGSVDKNQVTVRTRTSTAGEAVIEVVDTGCGIPAANQTRVFEPFFTTKPVGVGTGLGLSICHSIVTAAGGRIELVSPPEGGCLARVTLPPSRLAAARKPLTVPPPSRRRVLLVDDEIAIRRALCRLLDATHDVFLAENGQRALDLIDKTAEPFDVVLCDLMMPEMSGMELYDRLVASSSPLARRVVFMTGGAFSPRAHEFRATSTQPFLEKPIDSASLRAALVAVTP